MSSPAEAGLTRAMKTWTTETWMAAMPEEVLELLTAPHAIARWAPIPFELLEFDGRHLQTGSHARVRGGLAGGALRASIARIGAELEPALAAIDCRARTNVTSISAVGA
jgi:hypothetical protein